MPPRGGAVVEVDPADSTTRACSASSRSRAWARCSIRRDSACGRSVHCVSEYSESAQLIDFVRSASEDLDDPLDRRLRARRLVVGGSREARHHVAQLGERPARAPHPLEDVLLRLAVFLEAGLTCWADVVDALPVAL